MPTIRKRNGRYQAQIRVKGSAAITRTFTTKAEAIRWSKVTEYEATTTGLSREVHQHKKITMADALERYRIEIMMKRKWWQREVSIIKNVMRTPLNQIELTDVEEHHVANYRDHRLTMAKPATVVREIALLSNCFEIARREWGYKLVKNPFRLVKKPRIKNLVERRILPEELVLILAECHKSGSKSIAKHLLFTLETAVRKGELLNIRWSHINLLEATLLIPVTKNGFPRTIPLTPTAISILEKMTKDESSIFVFDIGYNGLAKRWEKLRSQCGFHDIRWHDTRHEAISRFFEMGLSIPEVAMISGHRDYKILFRYTHIRPENVAKKLAELYGRQGATTAIEPT